LQGYLFYFILFCFVLFCLLFIIIIVRLLIFIPLATKAGVSIGTTIGATGGGAAAAAAFGAYKLAKRRSASANISFPSFPPLFYNSSFSFLFPLLVHFFL
jgi:hypothetical protein